ncbi:MAG TPA: DUF488 domain-containing protein [Nitrospiraceae bacterium]|nr:DUF488 domain-containing protein [Nitrospiraceae bacterium]
MARRIWTVGHSTRPIETFLALVQAHAIQQIVDVRAFPYSRRNPQFHATELSASLQRAGLAYRHLPVLGGRRKSRPDSINQGWRNTSFRGYADYMQTEPFRTGLSELMTWANDQRTAIMCAEAVPWRCHRSLIADALTSQGWEVRHIMTPTKADLHRMTPFAQQDNGTLLYPCPDAESRPSLF